MLLTLHKIRNKEIHFHFLENDEFDNNTVYAKTVFKRALMGSITQIKKIKRISS